MYIGVVSAVSLYNVYNCVYYCDTVILFDSDWNPQVHTNTDTYTHIYIHTLTYIYTHTL
jgi:hypothetical protein